MENIEPRYGKFSSSTNPEEVASTVRGFIVSIASIILMVAPLAGLSLTLEQITTVGGQLGLAAGAIWTLYGLIMKAVVYFTKK